MIHNTFEINENPWWRPIYCDPREVGVITNTIAHLQGVVKEDISEEKKEVSDEFWKGYMVFHHQQYLMECISGESNITMNFEDVENLLNVSWIRRIYYRIFNKRHFRLVKKLRNLHRAATELFSNIFLFAASPLGDFDKEFVKQIHRKVGKGIIDNAGEFREKFAKPAGEDGFCYMQPWLIEERLEKLLKECRVAFSRPKLELLDAVKYGACFLANFLYIHPFSNGNGRTARLLLSYLLSQFTIVPLSLYTSGKTREVYLQCLRETRYDSGVMRPSSLCTFILEAIENEYLNYCFAMAVEVK